MGGMEHISPISVKDIIVVLSALAVVICVVINTISNQKRKPSADVDIAALQAKHCALKADLKAKQSTRVCEEIVERIDGHILQINQRFNEVCSRHADSEREASSKLAAVHERINTVLTAISTLGGKFEMHTSEKKS